MRQSVTLGRAFRADVMGVDRAKMGVTQQEIESVLTQLLQTYCDMNLIMIDVRISFCKTSELLNFNWHTELCVVTLEEKKLLLQFDSYLLTATHEYQGLVFVAKIWPLIMVVGKSLENNHNICGKFVFEVGDNASLNQVSFSSCNPEACVIMDHDFSNADAYDRDRALFSSDLTPWLQRRPDVFWRGSTTGRRSTQPPAEEEPDDLNWLPRLRLCQMALSPLVRDVCDIGIGQIVQVPEPFLTARIRDSGLMRAAVERVEFTRHRAVVDIDGNANAWSGLFLALLGGSCVLKVASQQGFFQWYYSDFTPWKHFVPIRSDFSDFYDAVLWFTNHDSHAHSIAESGREFANSITFEVALDTSANKLATWLQKAIEPRP